MLPMYAQSHAVDTSKTKQRDGDAVVGSRERPYQAESIRPSPSEKHSMLPD
jgi:hypothetical protein